MGLKDEIAVLAKVPLFKPLGPSQLKLLAFTSRRVTFDDGDLLCREGDPGDTTFVILSGSAAVIIDTDYGPMEIAAIATNDFVGELAILTDAPRTATVRAVGSVDALEIEKELFLRLVREFPDLAVQIMRDLAWRLFHTTRQLREAKSPVLKRPPQTDT